MLTTIKKFINDKFVNNYWASGANLLIFIGLVGPKLISASSTPLVVIGIVAGICNVLWFLSTLKK